MRQTVFVVEEIFRSDDEEERKAAIRRQIEQYLKNRLETAREGTI